MNTNLKENTTIDPWDSCELGRDIQHVSVAGEAFEIALASALGIASHASVQDEPQACNALQELNQKAS